MGQKAKIHAEACYFALKISLNGKERKKGKEYNKEFIKRKEDKEFTKRFIFLKISKRGS